MNVVKVNRRDFMKITSFASAGLVVSLRAQGDTNGEYPLGAFVEVGADGITTIYVSKSEMGQGVRTALPMMVADELDADLKRVRIRQADFDKKYGSMGTGGSSSIRTMWMPMRRAGATARAMLVAAAAKKWGVDAEDITVANGIVSSGSRKATFAELAPAASKLDVPKDVALKDPSKFNIIGKKIGRFDNTDLVRGTSNYGIDVRVPGMLYGVVLRSPVFGGRVASYDDTKAKAVPGVVAVTKIEPHGPIAPWTGVGGEAGKAVGVKADPKVHVTLLGGGFGRRAFPDVAVEAAVLSKAVGKPVKVQWTREDDIQHDFYRPANVHRIVAALDDSGKIAAWHHRIASAAINDYLGRSDAAEDDSFAHDQIPMFANFRLEFAVAKSAVPRGWWRSVENTVNAFTVQSMMDELAHAAGKDPIEFQLSMLPAGLKLERKNDPAYP